MVSVCQRGEGDRPTLRGFAVATHDEVEEHRPIEPGPKRCSRLLGTVAAARTRIGAISVDNEPLHFDHPEVIDRRDPVLYPADDDVEVARSTSEVARKDPVAGSVYGEPQRTPSVEAELLRDELTHIGGECEPHEVTLGHYEVGRVRVRDSGEVHLDALLGEGDPAPGDLDRQGHRVVEDERLLLGHACHGVDRGCRSVWSYRLESSAARAGRDRQRPRMHEPKTSDGQRLRRTPAGGASLCSWRD